MIAYEALMKVAEGSWQKLPYVHDPLDDHQVTLLLLDSVGEPLALTWRTTGEYPEVAQIIYVGHPDKF